MKSKLPLLLLLFNLVSCGTFHSSKQYIAMDSVPRGAGVINENREEIGTTPFLHHTSKSFRQHYYLKLSDTEKKSAYLYYKHRCRVAWQESILPNSLFSLLAFPVGAIISGAFIGVDYFTGGLFNCPGEIKFDLRDQKLVSLAPDKKRPRVILPLPIKVDDVAMADKIFETWRRLQFQKYREKTDTLIKLGDAKERLVFFGIARSSNWKPEDLQKKSLRRLGHELGATHLLYFEIRKRGTDFVLTPKLIDIFNQELTAADYLERFDVEDTSQSEPWFLKALSKTVTIVPNSFTFAPSFEREIRYTTDLSAGRELSSSGKEHPNALPRFLTSWGFEVLDYPALFDTWDYSLGVSPAILASAWQFRGTLRNQDYTLNFQNFTVMAQGSLTLHTPMGALWGGIGIGPAYTWASDNLGESFNRKSIMTRLALMYYAFVSERYFIEIGTNFYNVSRKIIQKPDFNIRGWRESYVAVGYYWPELKTKIEGFFSQPRKIEIDQVGE